MADDIKQKIITHQAGFQEKFVRSNVDICFGGGNLGGGKSFAQILSVAEPSLDPNFRAIILRKNLGDLKTTGGIVDDFGKCYGDYINIVSSGTPRITFPSGAFVECRHLADENPAKIEEQYKGVQADLIAFEEITAIEWRTFTYLLSRNRGQGRWSNKIRATTNPKKSHWIRTFLDWYIGADGFIIPERDGVVRYFFVNGSTVKDVVWGDTKEEVYEKCKSKIDRLIARASNGDISYEDLIKSFVFYQGKLSDNKALLGENKGYLGSVAATGGATSEMLLEGNWDIDPDEDDDIVLPHHVVREIFNNDPMRNGDMWITADIAAEGDDNFVALVWDGFHIKDKLVMGKTTPRQNVELIKTLMMKHRIAESHVIYDANNAIYIRDDLPTAIAFKSYYKPIGIDMFNTYSLKCECAWRLVQVIKAGMMSFDQEIADERYFHSNQNLNITFENEFIEECQVVRFKEQSNGRKRLMSKKEMNMKLGKGRSMDLLDPCIMRMYPVLGYVYGEELIKTSVAVQDTKYRMIEGAQSVYDETLWC